MTQEDKELLLKDLSARLRYRVEASVRGSDEECISFEVLGIKEDLIWVRNKMLLVDHFETIEVIRPYLRPMSSMTEEEFFNYKHLDLLDYSNDGFEMPNFRSIDWLNSHHFDYRGLIERSLALEAPKGMYKNF